MLDRLDRDGLLPAITFVFSRAGCDAVAQHAGGAPVLVLVNRVCAAGTP